MEDKVTNWSTPQNAGQNDGQNPDIMDEEVEVGLLYPILILHLSNDMSIRKNFTYF